ncbi:MAG: VCBS repeat-containing protein [Verrucomicrobia bacterium]|nr:VCBS repeat-containing protein [Verrucomicrobiota bacterium]
MSRNERPLYCTIALIALATLPAAALEWAEQEGHRRAALAVVAGGKTGFTEVSPAASGVTFTNRLGEERSLTNQIFLNGSGVAAGDVDGDGLCDLYFCGLDSPNALYRNLGNWHFADLTTAAGVGCAEQASTGAAFADVDGDGDLDLLVNGIARGTRLFLNDGTGKFRETTDEADLHNSAGSTTLALADIDGDGLLDLYVVNYRNDTMRDMPDIQLQVGVTNGVYHLLSVNGRPASAPDLVGRFSFDRAAGVLENGEADVLFRNVGNGRFASVSWTNGAFLDETDKLIETPYDWGLSAMFRDLNGDGAPDLYVCNDFQSPDRIWMNDGHGRFRALAREALRQTSLFSMCADFADIDRDGLDDIFVADMLSREHTRRQVQVMDAMAFAQFRHLAADRPQFSRNTLFRNRGNSTYAELAQLSGLDASDWSWCPVFLDVDLDGYEDLLITTGHWRDAQHADIAREIEEAKKQRPMSPVEQLRLRQRFPRLDTPNVAFRNRGDLAFEECGAAWGFDSRRIAQGMALADLDNDGDLDVIINCLNDAPLLCRNDSPRPRVAVRLRGLPPNTRGVGAKVRVRAPGLPPQSQEMICGGRYLSSDDFVRTFAAGSTSNRLAIEVIWRSGRRSLVTNAPANHVFEIDEAAAQAVESRGSRVESQAPPAGPRTTEHATRTPAPAASHQPQPSALFFEDVSHLLKHQHLDAPFDDFARQPLLPHALSQLGPGVSWFDFDGDGWEDLFIGAGRGGRLGVFRNDGKGGFVPQRAKLFEGPADRDLATVLGWRANPTNAALLIGLENYESSTAFAPSVRQVSLVTGAEDPSLFSSIACTGPLALADFDGDGDLDLFVGGRVIPERYPESTSSAMLRNEGGRLELDPVVSRAFARIGLVSGAVFTDLDGDGWPELVLACEWGALRLFKNDRGKLQPWDLPLRWTDLSPLASRLSPLSLLTGWWNSVGAGDFDGDGRLDVVAGNWGRNTPRQRFLRKPLRLYFGEAPGTGGLALLEAHHDPDLNKLVPARDWGALSAVFPMLRERFPTFASLSTASVAEVLAAGLPPMEEVTAATLDSMLLLHRGDHFEARPLPVEAQLAPVFGIAIGDLDGDGHEDLFLAQNFFGVAPVESRHDAGCGLWLRGDGHGDFSAVPPQDSGLAFYGEGRGAALGDFDHDGRLDLVVGQNRGATKLYRNTRGEPGLRIHLQGQAENHHAIGAVVRLVLRGERFGPAHEIRAGGGYWSQDASDVVLGTREEPIAVEIRWPGGIAERVAISPGARSFSRSQQPAHRQD